MLWAGGGSRGGEGGYNTIAKPGLVSSGWGGGSSPHPPFHITHMPHHPCSHLFILPPLNPTSNPRHPCPPHALYCLEGTQTPKQTLPCSQFRSPHNTDKPKPGSWARRRCKLPRESSLAPSLFHEGMQTGYASPAFTTKSDTSTTSTHTAANPTPSCAALSTAMVASSSKERTGVVEKRFARGGGRSSPFLRPPL